MEALEDRFNPTVVTIAAITHAVEGSSSMDFGANGAVRVSRDNTSGDLAVSYSVGGTATYGTDYTGANLGSITIPGGHSSIDLYYFPNFDSLVEGTETIVVSLGTPYGGYTVGSPSSATLNLYDNNTPRVTVAKQGSDPTEGGTGTFRISRTGSTAASLAVAFGTGGTATSGSDYTSIGTSATIGAGNSYVDVTVTTLADNVVDPSETVAMTITDGGSAYSAYGSSATATITIADDPVVVSIAATDTTEGSSGKFRISRAGGKTADSLTVNYSVTGGTASSGTDFTALSGTVVIGAGNSYADVTLTALADTLIEGDETVEVTVSSGGSVYTISGGVATAIIADDAPTISIMRLTDGFEGAGNGSFRVSRTGGDITQALTLTYTVGGTASSVSSADFTALSGTVTIAANASYADITVTITNDGTAEPTETVIATLGASTNYLVTGGPAMIFIWDNDNTAFHWTGASSGNWMTAGNWYENAVPGAGDVVYFDNAYSSNNSQLSGPLSAYAIGELHVLANYLGTITLSFPLATGSLMMLGGTIDQPSSGYGSNLTVTAAAIWTGGTLNSTANLASVIFNGAAVSIDGSSGLASGSDLEFVNAVAAIDKGTITFSNGTTGVVTGTSVVAITGGVLSPSSGTGGGVIVDGGTAVFYGATSIEWIHVLNGGAASTKGNAVLTVTGTVPTWPGVAVLVQGGDLNIQNGTSLNAGSNRVEIYGASGSGNLNTFASINAPGGAETATITTSKLIIGSAATGNTVVTLGNAAFGDQRFSKLQITGAVEWVKGSYVPNVSDTVGIRDWWKASGAFTIHGASTYVSPGGTTTANREEIVLDAASISAVDAKNATLPGIASPWAWKTGTAYGSMNWKVKRGS